MLEFYDEKGSCITSVKSDIVPHVGQLININKKTYIIRRITYAVDYSGMSFNERVMRANIDLVEKK